MLRSLEAIEDATLHFEGIAKERQAKVAVRPIKGQKVTELQIVGIKELVARAYDWLGPGNVAVTELSTGHFYPLRQDTPHLR